MGADPSTDALYLTITDGPTHSRLRVCPYKMQELVRDSHEPPSIILKHVRRAKICPCHTVAHSLPSLMGGAVCFAACVSHVEAFLFDWVACAMLVWSQVTLPLSAPSHRPPGPAVAGAFEARTCLLQLANKTLPLFASIAKDHRKLCHTVALSLHHHSDQKKEQLRRNGANSDRRTSARPQWMQHLNLIFPSKRSDPPPSDFRSVENSEDSAFELGRLMKRSFPPPVLFTRTKAPAFLHWQCLPHTSSLNTKALRLLRSRILQICRNEIGRGVLTEAQMEASAILTDWAARLMSIWSHVTLPAFSMRSRNGFCLEISTCLLQLVNKTLPLFASIAKCDRKLRHTAAHGLPSLMGGAVCFSACVSHMEAFLVFWSIEWRVRHSLITGCFAA